MLPKELSETQPTLKAGTLYEMLRADWSAMKSALPWETTKDEDWTRWLLNYFYDKGTSLGCKVETQPLGGNRGTGEYIFDLCWWKEDQGQYWLELALESEWLADSDEIDHDFYKLVDAKARLKVWVCSYGERQMPDKKSRLLEAVTKARYKFPEEEYLIVNIPYSEKAEYKDCLVVEGVWMNYLGNPNELRPFRIYRNS